jgi:acyl-CoA hydrolase
MPSGWSRRPTGHGLGLPCCSIRQGNPWGNVHGGTIMKLVDTAGAIAAHRHGRLRVVTAEIDSMRFLSAVHVGDLVTIRARVTAVWESSLETAVDVEAENVLTGQRRHTSSAYLVYVALDDDGTPTPLPPLLLETEEDHFRAREADARRRQRLAARAEGRALP